MTKNNIAIATITLARDEEEETLMQNALERLSQLKVPVFITDGGSRSGFLDFLRSFSNFILSKAEVKGVWPQAKNSLFEAYAHGSEFIFYTEPDKSDFFLHLPTLMTDVQADDKLGIVLASRSAAGFATFPAFQRMTETTINNCCEEIIGSKFDYTYGPFLLRRQLVPYLDLVKEDIGWGWRPYVFGTAHRLGFRVESYARDFTCPLQQRQDTASERLYRMKQLSQNMQGIVLSNSVTLKQEAVL